MQVRSPQALVEAYLADGLRVLAALCYSAAALQVVWRSTAPALPRLGSDGVATALYEVWRASSPFCFYRHPALVRRSCASPSMAARAPSSRRPVSARSLRCGLRSSFLVTTPSLRSVATTRLHATSLTFTRWQAVSFGSGLVCFTGVHPRFPASCRVPPGGIVPPGYVMRRPSRPPCLRRVRSTPGWRHRAEDCDALRVRRGRFAPVRSRLRGRCAWSASSRKLRWLPAIAAVASRPANTRGEHQAALWFRRLASAS